MVNLLVHVLWDVGIRKAVQFKKLLDKVYYTNSLMLPIKMMLCSKLHCQKFFRLKSFSYKIALHFKVRGWKCPPEIQGRKAPDQLLPRGLVFKAHRLW